MVLPVRERPGKVTLDVRVHDRLEVMELAVLQQIYYVNLERQLSFVRPKAHQDVSVLSKQTLTL